MRDPNQMSFLDHLEELRWHLIRSVVSVLLFGTVAFIFKDFIFCTNSNIKAKTCGSQSINGSSFLSLYFSSYFPNLASIYLIFPISFFF